MSAGHIVAAVAVHLLLFLVFYLAAVATAKPKEAVIPIDLEVVVNENLDGEENEPPPLNDVPPPKPPEKVPERPKPPEPPPPEPIKDAVVTSVVKKVKGPPKQEPPKKTMEDRLKEMLASAKEVKPSKPKPTKPSAPPKVPLTIKLPDLPSGNGRTGKKTLSDEEVRKLLAAGYRPGTEERLATSEMQRCVSLIQAAFYAKWDQVGRPAWTDSLRTIRLRVQFGPGGVVKGWELVQGSTDSAADQTVLKAAALVKAVPGLSSEFLRNDNGVVIVNFKVTPQ